MSSTEQTKSTRVKLGLAALLVAATCASSLSFSSQAKAQDQVLNAEQTAVASTVEVALVGAALAAYGWAADKTYELGRQVGHWLAGSTPEQQSQALAEQNADYLLN